MGIWGRLRWNFRRELWNWIARTKFKKNQPLAILPVPRSFEPMVPVPLSRVFPDVTVLSLVAASRIPDDEKRPYGQYVKKRLMFGVQRVLYQIFPPMQRGLPMIESDKHAALAHGYRSRHDRVAKAAAAKARVPRDLALARPVLPAELCGQPDLGLLAVRGPYAAYLQRVSDEVYEWDLQQFAEPTVVCHEGLYRPWAHVRFRRDPGSRTLRAAEIRTELGTARPGEVAWPLAERIALCAVTTHTSLVRHWNWLHLMAGESLSIATRNALRPHHPVCRLLWPHLYGTQQSNRFGNAAQLVPRGDFEQTYSLTHEGMCALLESSSREFLLEMGNPGLDARRRGLTDSGIDLPTQENLEALYRVMHRHAQRYVGLYYSQDADVHADEAVRAWVDGLHRLLPHAGFGGLWPLTAAELADMLARVIYLVTAYHESVGALLWNYQMWTSLHPIRVYRDGRREPLDVYQRLVNTNYLLQVIRAPLMADYSGVVLDESKNPQRTDLAKEAFRTFLRELEALQRAMDLEPPGLWKLYPRSLEVNINA